MSWMDMLGGLLGGAAQAAPQQSVNQFDEIAKMLPAGALTQGLSAMFNSSQTPAFGNLVGELFGNSNPAQKAGMLNTILAAAGPLLATGAAGGLLSQLTGGGQRQITPDEAANLSPEVVTQLASQVEKHDPSIVDVVSNFYSEHPTLVKTLGGAALSIALAKVAESYNK